MIFVKASVISLGLTLVTFAGELPSLTMQMQRYDEYLRKEERKGDVVMKTSELKAGGVVDVKGYPKGSVVMKLDKLPKGQVELEPNKAFETIMKVEEKGGQYHAKYVLKNLHQEITEYPKLDVKVAGKSYGEIRFMPALAFRFTKAGKTWLDLDAVDSSKNSSTTRTETITEVDSLGVSIVPRMKGVAYKNHSSFYLTDKKLFDAAPHWDRIWDDVMDFSVQVPGEEEMKEERPKPILKHRVKEGKSHSIVPTYACKASLPEQKEVTIQTAFYVIKRQKAWTSFHAMIPAEDRNELVTKRFEKKVLGMLKGDGSAQQKAKFAKEFAHLVTIGMVFDAKASFTNFTFSIDGEKLMDRVDGRLQVKLVEWDAKSLKVTPSSGKQVFSSKVPGALTASGFKLSHPVGMVIEKDHNRPFTASLAKVEGQPWQGRIKLESTIEASLTYASQQDKPLVVSRGGLSVTFRGGKIVLKESLKINTENDGMKPVLFDIDGLVKEKKR